MATQEVGNIVNATNVVEGISPHWNEMIYIEISEDMNRSEGRRRRRFPKKISRVLLFDRFDSSDTG